MSRPGIIETNTSEIWVDELGILRVKAKEGAELTFEEAEICFKAYKQLGFGKNNKALFLSDLRAYCSITKEGREYAARHGKDFFIASAVITNNLPVRLLSDFFGRFYKIEMPFKLFETEEKAVEWLLNAKNQNFFKFRKA